MAAIGQSEHRCADQGHPAKIPGAAERVNEMPGRISMVAVAAVALLVAVDAWELAAQSRLAVTVRHPSRGAVLSAGDSTFIFGTVSRATASLRVDGVPVPVDRGG